MPTIWPSAILRADCGLLPQDRDDARYPGGQVIRAKHGDWEQALVDSVTHARALVRVDPARIALLGFSLGGYLCLSIRAAVKPRALVEYFTPMFGGIDLPRVGSFSALARASLG